MSETSRVAVVLFNLGGPDSTEAVRPFLHNLFSDPAIINAPGLIRRMLAWLIARRRAPIARRIYEEIGGRSPILPLTEAQAAALQARLREIGIDARVFIAMRYWHPMSGETAREVASFKPDQVILLPLYPQYSTTTTGSSAAAWREAAVVTGLAARTSMACCYPRQGGWIAAQARLIGEAMSRVPAGERTRILFSAHGLPKRVIAAGDPYQWQVEQTAAAVIEILGDAEIDHRICYQSRVGPLEWIGPSTEAELERAAADGVGVVLTPIAFVSEHSETLVELDIEYRQRAEKLGIRHYIRVPAVGTAPEFIAGLAEVVAAGLRHGGDVVPPAGKRLCPISIGRCACGVSGQEE